MQHLRLPATATSDASGKVTITFPTPHVGTEWLATFSVPDSPANVTWTVTIGPSGGAGTIIGSIQGASSFGEIHLHQLEVVTLTASGVSASTTYQGLVNVTEYPAGQARPPVLRNPTSSLAAVTFGETLLATLTSSDLSVSIEIPPTCQAIAILGQVTGATVQGKTSGRYYPAAAFRTAIGSNDRRFVAMIDPAIDTAITVAVTSASSSWYLLSLSGVQAVAAFEASVGPLTDTMPAYGTLMGGENPSGNLAALQLDAAGRLLLPPSSNAGYAQITVAAASPFPSASIVGTSGQLLRGLSFRAVASSSSGTATFSVTDATSGDALDHFLFDLSVGYLESTVSLGPGGYQLTGPVQIAQTTASSSPAGFAIISARW